MIDVYLGTLGDGVIDLSIDTYVQRYPINTRDYLDSLTYDIESLRYSIWMWMAPVIFTVAFYYPMQTFSAEAVREGTTKIHDLLEVSGISFFAYWASYVIMGLVVGIFVLLLALGLLSGAVPIISPLTSGAYMRVLVAFSLGITIQCLALQILSASGVLRTPSASTANYSRCRRHLRRQQQRYHARSQGLPRDDCAPYWPRQRRVRYRDVPTSDSQCNNFRLLLDQAPAQLPSVSSIAILLLGTVLSFLFAWGYPFEWVQYFSKDNLVILNEDEANLQYMRPG